jgi:S1-C subfamily serine protease
MRLRMIWTRDAVVRRLHCRIGCPLGLEGTVSDGIVSALRDLASKKWIQTTVHRVQRAARVGRNWYFQSTIHRRSL